MPGVTTAYQTGVHGSRPANGAGCILYSCTTHSLVYRDDGTTWTTFMTLTGTGYTAGGTDVAIADGGTGQSTATLGFNALSPVTTRGDLIVRGATNNDRLAIGTTGKVLTSDGTDPSWQTPSAGAAGALVLLEQYTASASASLDFTTFISSTYDEYLFELVNLVPATNSVAFLMRMGTGGGPTYDAGTNYGWVSFSYRSGASGSTGVDSGQTAIQLAYNGTISNNANWGVTGSLRLYSPQSTALYKQVAGQISILEASPFMIGNVDFGAYRSTTAVTAIRFLFSSGNIASGTIRVYGVAK